MDIEERRMSWVDFAAAQYHNFVHSAPTEAEALFRRQAWDEYTRLGLPDRKNDSWRYTTLSGLEKVKWASALGGLPVLQKGLRLRDELKNEFDVLIIQNGELRFEESIVDTSVFRLQKVAFAPGETFNDGFLGLTAAASLPGASISLTAGVRPAKPLLIMHIGVGEKAWTRSYHQLFVGAGAHLDVVELFLGVDKYLRSEIIRLEAADRAQVNWLRIQDESGEACHFSDVRAALSAEAILNLAQLNIGASWVRSTLGVDVRGGSAEANIFGLNLGSGQQETDQRVVVNHWAAQSNSSQLFKGVLKDRARAVMNGRIFIAQNAQKVISRQLNHNLLLSSGAEANTKPELEIYADDVKANHGASVGRLDEDKIFYLESRGIPRAEALQLLAKAFATDILMKISPEPCRLLAEKILSQTLPEFVRQMEYGG